MPDTRRWLRVAVFAALFVLLFLSARFGLTSKTNYTMDTFSNELVISDMLHDKLYPGAEKGNWMQFVGALHTESCPDGYVTEVFESNGSLPEDAFVEYCSQLGLHSKVYSLLAQALPISPRRLIQLLYSLNALLYAAALTGVLWWLSRAASLPAAVAVGLQCALLSPSLQGYGMNLYWAGWSLFLPMAAMALLTQSKAFVGKRSRLWCFAVAFGACLLKLYVYNEFVSTVMVAMMIPWCYARFASRAPLRQMLAEVWFPVLGALAAFAIACGMRVVHIHGVTGDWAEAWQVFMERISVRVGGAVTEITTGSALTAAQASVWQTVWLMLTNPLLWLGGVPITALGLSLAFSAFAAAGLATLRHLPKEAASRLRALLGAAALSVLAPLSWFVLAKPHTYVHSTQCSALWYLPYLLMTTAFAVELILQWILLARRKPKAIKA